ncbi:uncharacterized protein [Temnothorax nylanderi]|uniref:uncharacterized protein n=1 Tax=Temnothorax nylanderi TaxID=102681 RepID=UPI003A867ABB
MNSIIDHIHQQLALSNFMANACDNFVRMERSGMARRSVDANLLYLKGKWDRFQQNHDVIILAITKLAREDKILIQSHSYFTDEIFPETRTCYLASVEKVKAGIYSETQRSLEPSSIRSMIDENPVTNAVLPSAHSVESETHMNDSVHNPYARLPRIEIPKFDGTPSEWLNYKDLFASLVLKQKNLSSVEKLQYLKTSLIDSAAHYIKNTSLTEENFTKTWEALLTRYDNPRLQLNTALRSLVRLKPMTKEVASELELIHTTVIQIHRTLETLQRPMGGCEDFLIFLTVEKLDPDTVKAWDYKLGSSKIPPTWDEFDEFLMTRLFSLQSYERSRIGKFPFKQQKLTAKAHYQGKSDENSAKNKNVCPICKGKHYVMKCPKYIDETTSQKLALIVKHKLCYNCLGTHRIANCKVTKRCQKCDRRHHTSIHKEDGSFNNNKNNIGTSSKNGGVKSESQPQSNLSGSDQDRATVLHSIKTIKSTKSQVMLATAKVLVMSERKVVRKVRALLDQGSEISLVSERIVQQLHLPRSHSSISLSGIGDQKSKKTKGSTFFKLKPHFNSNFELSISAHILPKLTTSIPSVKVPCQSWSHLEGIQKADPDCFLPGSIDLILGADVYGSLLENGLLKGSISEPIAQATKLGWVVSGPTDIDAPFEHRQIYRVSIDNELHDLVRKFWEVEEIPSSDKPILSPDEQACEDHFLSTHLRDETGRYVVRLPFKGSPEELGNSKIKAERMMRSLASKFEKDSNHAALYRKFMHEYKQLNHMERISDSKPEPSSAYYLPHHGVLREQSLTTKLRVVFNGSCPTSNGISLNDLLHTGAKLQTDLFDVLLWFRFYLYAFTADIEKMFRQIKVNSADWDYQRIFWLDELGKIIIFVLITVTYGLACAPFLALRALVQLVLDEGQRFPLAKSIMEKGRYVDEFHGGANSIIKAKQRVAQLDALLMAGGFTLKKWVSNNPAILEDIPPDRKITFLQNDQDKLVNVLGLTWDINTIPEPSLSIILTSRLSRWQLLQQKLESFWSLWSKEYLQRQLSIYKWNKVNPSITEGTVVLLVDERYPTSKWPLGRITKTHPGKDDHVRVVTVRTQASTYQRPITKICPLPVQTESF